jgi:hypothetical protein
MVCCLGRHWCHPNNEMFRHWLLALRTKIGDPTKDVQLEVNAAAVVSAVTAYARINARGELIERTETINLNPRCRHCVGGSP